MFKFWVGGACGPPPPVAASLVPRSAVYPAQRGLLPAATPRLRTLRVRFGPAVPISALALIAIGLVGCGGPTAAPTAQPGPAATSVPPPLPTPTAARAASGTLAPDQPTVEPTASSSDVE